MNAGERFSSAWRLRKGERRDRKKGIGVRLSLSMPARQQADEIANRVKSAGIALESEPRDTEWNSRAFGLVDPSGYLLTIFSEARP